MDIQTFHRYNKLVRRGIVKAITCPSCGYEYILRATEDGDPVLECMTCSIRLQPGLRLYSDILSVVKEHFE